jgi:TRAP-type C4-dicarboxylate transport system substrate-binding protein
MNRKLWDSLAADDKKLLMKVADQVMAEQAKAAEKDETEFKKKLTDAGVQVVEITPAEWEVSAKAVRTKGWPRIENELLGKILMDKVKVHATKISQ